MSELRRLQKPDWLDQLGLGRWLLTFSWPGVAHRVRRDLLCYGKLAWCTPIPLSFEKKFDKLKVNVKKVVFSCAAAIT